MSLTKEQEIRLSQDLEATQNLMLRNSTNYGILSEIKGDSPFINKNKYESLYSNATEDMATYYKEFKTTNSFLTIGASGEQVANAINAGAKIIDVYDSNRLCRHALYLRLAAIQALSLEEFMEYYRTFSPLLFIKIVDYLNEEEKIYWKSLYNMFGKKNLISGDMLNKLLFTYKRLDEELIRKINPYLNPENYDKLKSLISSVTINYIDSDLYSLPRYIDKKSYDVINLSNIYEYINYNNDVKFKNARKYRSFVLNQLLPHLNQNGSIMVSYLYAWSDVLNKDFAIMYKEAKGKVVGTSALNLDDYFKYYLPGLTTQNLAYHYLFEAFKDTNAIKVPTEHVQYGQSKDMSHDCALILRK